MHGHNTDILGCVLEKATRRLDKVIADRVTDPLGMKDTHFFLPPAQRDRLAAVHAPARTARPCARPKGRRARGAASVHEVVVLGRRGPAQAAFTTPELRELGELTRADIIIDPADLELDPYSAQWLEEEGDPTNKRNVDLMREYAVREPHGTTAASSCASCAHRWRSSGTTRPARSPTSGSASTGSRTAAPCPRARRRSSPAGS